MIITDASSISEHLRAHSAQDDTQRQAQIMCSSAPAVQYDPQNWQGRMQKNNNCYDYALNLQFEKQVFLDPGMIAFARGDVGFDDLAFYDDKSLSIAEFQKRVNEMACADGLTQIPALAETSNMVGREIALTTSATQFHFGWDYHWLRKDADGLWSHKTGEEPVRRIADVVTEMRDNAASITQLAQSLPVHNQFSSRFLVPKSGVMPENKQDVIDAYDDYCKYRTKIRKSGIVIP